MWTFAGTHKGEFQGFAPSRKKIKISGVGVALVRRGKIEEVVSMFDSGSFRATIAGQRS